MYKFNKNLTVKLININIRVELLLCYVDDITLVIRFKRSDFGFHSDLPMDKQIAGEIVLQADQKYPESLKFESDVCSNHPDNKVPVLDFKVSLQDNQIQTEFYKKSMASNAVMLFRLQIFGSSLLTI